MRKAGVMDLPDGVVRQSRVERVNGELQNTVIHTFPRVSQFWKYDPADYLRQPLYSRR